MFVLDSGTVPFGMVCHPKTASQATRAALRRLGAHAPGGHHGIRESECHRILEAGGVIACTVRNPWDLIVSWWGYQQTKPYNKAWPEMAPFSEWLDDLLANGNGFVEKGLFYGLDYCNRVIRFEGDIQLQLNQILSDCGLPSVTLDVVGKSPRTAYQDYYTKVDDIWKVYNRFRTECDEWGYTYED